ncbi:MAG: hypothetical protein LBS27_10985 [Bifidobacteriaceae bacterium]|jgi:Flp pilus assembly pilin Flp|nr:hypothetical protein [Bifidobacteriaceae bacterium]
MSKFEDLTTAVAVRAQGAAARAHDRLRRFRDDESGMEIIAVVIILVIVVLLAVAFRNQLGTFFTDLWSTITGSTGDLTQDF